MLALHAGVLMDAPASAAVHLIGMDIIPTFDAPWLVSACPSRTESHLVWLRSRSYMPACVLPRLPFAMNAGLLLLYMPYRQLPPMCAPPAVSPALLMHAE